MSTAPISDSNPSIDAPSIRSRHPFGHLPAARTGLLELFNQARDLGPVVDLRMAHVTITVVSSPSAVHHMLVKKTAQYAKTTRGYQILRLLLGNGLVTAMGDDWRRHRRIANPAFRRDAVAGFVTTMTDSTQAWLNSLPAQAGSVDIAQAMHRLTLEIAGKTLLSRDLSARGDTIGEALETVLPGFDSLSRSVLPRPWRWPLPATRRFMKGVRKLDQVTKDIIQERRADPRNHPDLLGMLMLATDPETGAAMTDQQLRDEVLTMLLAGHETTANAMAWTLHLLAQHPKIADAVHAEVMSVVGEAPITASHIGQLDLTSRVFDESLRLYPPIWVHARQALQADVIDGVTIPEGRMLFIHTYGLHRHPELWDAPDSFDPDRFLPQRSAAMPHGAYHPFSMGQRKCIGDRFAKTEGITLLAMMVRSLHFASVPGAVVLPEPSLTLRPRGGLTLRVTRRE
ncbi:MAG: cytochrome P450 [Myxococcota bacterium]|jgi:cytochrome P450